jgi:hypothetical protein
MRWVRIRKAKIGDTELRKSFERYGTTTMQILLASHGQFRKGPAGSLTNISTVEDPLLDWLTEQHDIEQRKETWSLAMEVAIVVFVGAELLFSVFGRTAALDFSGLVFSVFRAFFRCLSGFC